MPYKVGLPKNKENLAEATGSLSLQLNGGDTGDMAPTTQSCDPTEGKVIAYLIASEVLGADIWLALNDDFDSGDGLAVFYAAEIPFLRTKSTQELREIHEAKSAFPGSWVRQ